MGDADLSVDVDFQSLMYYLGTKSKLKGIGIVSVLMYCYAIISDKYNFMTQGRFLESMGIMKRAEVLSAKIEDIEKAVDRLVNPKEMGKIYKVLEFSRQ